MTHTASGLIIEPSCIGFDTLRDYDLTFADLQREVGGSVEYVRCTRGVLAVNEDGRPLGLAPNPVASDIAEQPIVGTAVLLRRAL